MGDKDIFLTATELSDRWKGSVAVGTLNNWRYLGAGLPYIKIGEGKNSAVLYRLSDIVRYERRNEYANSK